MINLVLLGPAVDLLLEQVLTYGGSFKEAFVIDAHGSMSQRHPGHRIGDKATR